MRGTFALPFMFMALLAGRARAGYVPQETLTSLSQKSEIIVVGEIVKVEDVPNSSEKFKGTAVIHQRATVKVTRGINTADAKPLALDTIVIDYLDDDRNVAQMIVNGPILPTFDLITFLPLKVGTLAVFPVKRGDETSITDAIDAPGTLWHFVSEEGTGLMLPATTKVIDAKPAATAKEYLQRELAGNFAKGDFLAITRAASYINTVCWTYPEVTQPICNLIEPEIHDDARWLDIAVAGYGHLPTPRPSIAELRTGKKEDFTSTLLVQLALAKANPDKLDERLLRAMIARQGERGTMSNLPLSLSDNYRNSPLLVELEGAALADAKPGALTVVAELTKDFKDHPLIAPALAAARSSLAELNAGKAASTDYIAAARVIMRQGNDADFAFLLEQVTLSQKSNPDAFKSFLDNVSAGTLTRKMRLCSLYLDVTTPLAGPPTRDTRICDQAAMFVQQIAGKEFGLKYDDPIKTRDEVIARVREWLKTQ